MDGHKFVNKIKEPRKSDLGWRTVGKSDKEWGEVHFSPSSERMHKGTDKVAPYGYKRDIIFGETAIARDITNVRKKR